jgi:hypothetical protein
VFRQSWLPAGGPCITIALIRELLGEPTQTVLGGSCNEPQVVELIVAVTEPDPDPLAKKVLGLPGSLSKVRFELQVQVTLLSGGTLLTLKVSLEQITKGPITID